VGHGGWLDWLEREFGWNAKTAERFMTVAAAAEASKFDTLSNLNIGVSSLYLLAPQSTPQAAVEEVAKSTEAGEDLSTEEVKEIVQKHKQPTKTPEAAPADDPAASAEVMKRKVAELDRDAGATPIIDAKVIKNSATEVQTGTKVPIATEKEFLQYLEDLLRSIKDRMPSPPLRPKAFFRAGDLVGKIFDALDDGLRRAEPPIRKVEASETTLGAAVDDAYGRFQELSEECREVVDNAPPGLDQTERIQTLDQTASTLEELASPEVAPELAGIKITVSKPYRVRSRSDQRDGATSLLDAAMQALNGIGEDDPRHQAASALCAELNDALDQAEACEFPGCRG
jgi:hypothetical protein